MWAVTITNFERGRKAGAPGEKPPTIGPIIDRVTYRRENSHPAHGGDRTHALAVVTVLATSVQARCLIRCATDRPQGPFCIFITRFP